MKPHNGTESMAEGMSIASDLSPGIGDSLKDAGKWTHMGCRSCSTVVHGGQRHSRPNERRVSWVRNQVTTSKPAGEGSVGPGLHRQEKDAKGTCFASYGHVPSSTAPEPRLGVSSNFEKPWASSSTGYPAAGLFKIKSMPQQSLFPAGPSPTPVTQSATNMATSDRGMGPSSMVPPQRGRKERREEFVKQRSASRRGKAIIYTTAPKYDGIREQPEYKAPSDIGPPSPSSGSYTGVEGPASDLFGAPFAPNKSPKHSGLAFGGFGSSAGNSPGSTSRGARNDAPRMRSLAGQLGEMELGEGPAVGVKLSQKVDSVLYLADLDDACPRQRPEAANKGGIDKGPGVNIENWERKDSSTGDAQRGVQSRKWDHPVEKRKRTKCLAGNRSVSRRREDPQEWNYGRRHSSEVHALSHVTSKPIQAEQGKQKTSSQGINTWTSSEQSTSTLQQESKLDRDEETPGHLCRLFNFVLGPSEGWQKGTPAREKSKRVATLVAKPGPKKRSQNIPQGIFQFQATDRPQKNAAGVVHDVDQKTASNSGKWPTGPDVQGRPMPGAWEKSEMPHLFPPMMCSPLDTPPCAEQKEWHKPQPCGAGPEAVPEGKHRTGIRTTPCHKTKDQKIFGPLRRMTDGAPASRAPYHLSTHPSHEPKAHITKYQRPMMFCNPPASPSSTGEEMHKQTAKGSSENCDTAGNSMRPLHEMFRMPRGRNSRGDLWTEAATSSSKATCEEASQFALHPEIWQSNPQQGAQPGFWKDVMEHQDEKLRSYLGLDGDAENATAGNYYMERRTTLKVKEASGSPGHLEEKKCPQAVTPIEGRTQDMKQSEEQALAAGKACRRLGNDMFASGLYARAEAEYTLALEKLKGHSKIEQSLAPIFSNRAAARLMMDQPESALEDCQSAVMVDKLFVRGYVRGATCFVRLGNFSEAKKMLEPAFHHLPAASGHHVEVAAKLKDIQQLEKQFQGIKARLSDDGLSEPGIRGALEELKSMAGEMGRSEELWALLMQSLVKVGEHHQVISELKYVTKRLDLKPPNSLWWQWIGIQAWFHMAECDEMIQECKDLISELEKGQRDGVICPVGITLGPSLGELRDAVVAQETVGKLKSDGNDAIREKDYKKAIELYGEALSASCKCSAPARIVAILHANRAAAHQGLASYAEAIADCCMARALDASYTKSQSRLARLLIDIRRPQAAVAVLQKLSDSHSLQGGSSQRLEHRLRDALAFAEREPTPDHYMLLGLPRSCRTEDVRKTYKQLALRFHPDKVALRCRYNLRFGTSGVKMVGEWQILKCIEEEAGWLFKLINEACDALCNVFQRKRLDRELALDELLGQGGYAGSTTANRSNVSWRGHHRNHAQREWEGFQKWRRHHSRQEA